MQKRVKTVAPGQPVTRNLETLLMATSRSLGVDREMLKNAVKVLHDSQQLEAKIHRYY